MKGKFMFKKAFKNFPSLGRGVRGEGFTLAEVLITLMIIGIVAALTIPSVISNYQQQEFKTGLKKAVSVLNEAIQMNIINEGETPYDTTNLFKYLQKHMSVIKTGYLNHCYNKTTGGSVLLNDNQNDCLEAGAGYYRNNIFYTTDGMRFETPSVGGNGKELLLHETNVNIAPEDRRRNACGEYGCNYYIIKSGFCGSYGLTNNPNNTTTPPCAILVDVNGDRKPNPPEAYATGTKSVEKSWGTSTAPVNQNFVYTYPSLTDKKLQDVFTIMITDEKAIPFGVVAQRAMYSK